MKHIILFSLAVPMFAMAQAQVAVAPTKVERAPVIAPQYILGCASGTTQVGGAKSNMQLLGCMKRGPEGERIFDGPMFSFYEDGKVEAQGQAVNGFRSGKWVFFDRNGLKAGETEFKAGDFHGRRIQFFSNGAVKSDEFWVNGKRQGPQTTFDEAGTPTVVNYLDDRAVAK